ncbi:hypothetical protein PQX77_012854 [Marasmius sp. AFHP31]|nr:hypothetical protein PQX77_012854 [Marasmius sp. AFHP31]
MSRNAQDETVNEETALLGQRKQQRTPLAHGQIALVMLMQICEPLASQSIYPYINQLVSELDITGGDEKKVGYYAGLIRSVNALLRVIANFLGSGYQSMFNRAVEWEYSLGVMKSTMGDLTDQSNRAEGFALMPVVWSIGASCGPLLGGTFARPQDRFPDVFKGRFWRDFPYFMPCLVVASFILTVAIVVIIFFKESAPIKKHSRNPSTDSDMTVVASDTTDNPKNDGPLPLRDLLVWPVVISISNYVSLAFLNIAFNALLPLFLAMPISIGGLGLSPPTIGYIMGGYGGGSGIFQFFYFAKIMHWFGERRMFLNGISTFVVMFALMPICNVIARANGGVDGWCWGIIGLIIVLAVAMDMAYGSVFMYVTASAPNKSALGATNGLSQTAVSIARAIGPAMATSLFSLSVQENILGGYGVYALFCILSVGGVVLGTMLPKEVWDEPE